MKNKYPTYHYKRNGLCINIYSNSKSTGLKKRLIVSPEFVQLLDKIESNEKQFDEALWRQLSQVEKNFIYEINQDCKIFNKELEMEHLKESNKLMDRLKLLEGSIMAGNAGDLVKKEFVEILDQLVERRQLTKFITSKMKSVIQRF